MNPLTDYIIYLLTTRPTRAQAGVKARELGVRGDWGMGYFETIGRR